MRRVVTWCLVLVTLGAFGLVSAVAIWVFPEVSALRAECAAGARSAYPPHVLQAFLAAEDPYFLATVKPNDHLHGSTLTQQMAKTVTMPTRGIGRMIKGVLVAFAIDRSVPKSWILNAYLNGVYLGNVAGHRVYGVPFASRVYFGHAPEDLTLPEAATLAGMVRSPRVDSVRDHPERAITRRQAVLEAMLSHGFISPEELATASHASLNAAPY